MRDDFCHHIGRQFSYDTDNERLSPECISSEPKKAYILLDFNIKTKGLDLDTIPLFLVAVTYNESGEAYVYAYISSGLCTYCHVETIPS